MTMGPDGALYVCQNGGTVGPWRAAEMVDASIQRVREGGKAEMLITEVEGIKLNGVDIITFNEQGLITHFKVMVRPLKAINLLHRLMGEQLAKP